MEANNDATTTVAAAAAATVHNNELAQDESNNTPPAENSKTTSQHPPTRRRTVGASATAADDDDDTASAAATTNVLQSLPVVSDKEQQTDGRKSNRGAASRTRMKNTQKVKMILDIEQALKKKTVTSVSGYVQLKSLPDKFRQFLSDSKAGWRNPATRAAIFQQAKDEEERRMASKRKKVDGRKGNKGSSTRNRISVEHKAAVVLDFEAALNDGTVKSLGQYVKEKGLDRKYRNFLSQGKSGWRYPETRSALLAHHANESYKDRKTTAPQRCGGKHAMMENVLEQSMLEKLARHEHVSTHWIQMEAKKIMKTLQPLEEFMASKGWARGFLRRKKFKFDKDEGGFVADETRRDEPVVMICGGKCGATFESEADFIEHQETCVILKETIAEKKRKHLLTRRPRGRKVDTGNDEAAATTKGSRDITKDNDQDVTIDSVHPTAPSVSTQRRKRSDDKAGSTSRKRRKTGSDQGVSVGTAAAPELSTNNPVLPLEDSDYTNSKQRATKSVHKKAAGRKSRKGGSTDCDQGVDTSVATPEASKLFVDDVESEDTSDHDNSKPSATTKGSGKKTDGRKSNRGSATRHRISYEMKAKMIREVEMALANGSAISIADFVKKNKLGPKFKICLSKSINGWRYPSTREAIMDLASKEESRQMTSKPKRDTNGAKFKDMEDEVYEFVVETRRRCEYMASSVVREKAKQIMAQTHPNENFIGSTGWFNRFVKRRNIKFSKPLGFGPAADTPEESITLPPARMSDAITGNDAEPMAEHRQLEQQHDEIAARAQASLQIEQQHQQQQQNLQMMRMYEPTAIHQNNLNLFAHVIDFSNQQNANEDRYIDSWMV